MKILLAGPGTGKTTKVKTIIEKEYSNAKDILILSFTNATINDLTNSFSGYSNVRCYTLHSYALIINHLTSHHILDDNNETPILQHFAEKYQIDFDKLCYFFQCITFDAMIKECLDFLISNPAYGKEKIGNLDLLIIDEFQDFNLKERELIYQISKYSKQTLVLGDDDQSIYGFKDADPMGIIDLYNNQDSEKIIHENICYRCPDVIVDYSKNLISKNIKRIDKPWKKSGKKGDIKFAQTMSQEETTQFLLNEIKTIKSDDSGGSILVLSPVRYYADSLISALDSEKITFVDFWALRTSEEDIRKIWWLKAIFSNKRLLNLTFIANDTFSSQHKNKYNQLLRDALQRDFDEERVIDAVKKMFAKPFSDYLSDHPTIVEFMKTHDEFSKFESLIDYENLEESLKNISKKFNPNPEFRKDAINIMSIHKSKGLQADYVFISGLVDGILPNKMTGLDTIEAQRRLLFVGMTRAMKSLYILSQVEWDGKYVHRVDKSQFKYDYRKKKYFGKTSNFVNEMRPK